MLDSLVSWGRKVQIREIQYITLMVWGAKPAGVIAPEGMRGNSFT